MRPLAPPPLQGLIAAGAIWLTDSLLPEARIAFPGQAWIALGCGAVGLSLDLSSILAFFRVRTTVNPLAPERSSRLVTTGFYRFTRNPMYLGLLLLLTGWTVWLGNPLGGIWLAAFVGCVTVLQIHHEEAALRRTFGAEFDAYCRKVRRWL